MSLFFDRMVRAAKLDPNLYEEVEADRSSLGQAMGAVVISSVAAGIGGAGDTLGPGGVVASTLWALASWYVWAYLTYFIGTRLLPEPETEADHGELLRTVGFAASPGVVRILGVIPGLGRLAFLAGSVWMLVAMVIAVRQALDYRSTARAVGVSVTAWVIQALALALLFSVFGVPGSPP